MGGLKRILLAEDSPEDVELTLSALSENRLANEVVTVGDGAEALDYLYKRGRYADRAGGLPSVVLLDIKMPKVDGLEVLRRIRSDPAMATLPVVMLTSSREESDIIESYKHHVNAYVVKPVAFPDFVEAIKSLGLFWGILNQPPPASNQKAA